MAALGQTPALSKYVPARAAYTQRLAPHTARLRSAWPSIAACRRRNRRVLTSVELLDWIIAGTDGRCMLRPRTQGRQTLVGFKEV